MRHSKRQVGDYQYSCKVLTHVIRLNDGHVMPDWIDCKPSQAEDISRRLRNREFDTDNYAVIINKGTDARGNNYWLVYDPDTGGSKYIWDKGHVWAGFKGSKIK
jgi:hypothetical protein